MGIDLYGTDSLAIKFDFIEKYQNYHNFEPNPGVHFSPLYVLRCKHGVTAVRRSSSDVVQ